MDPFFSGTAVLKPGSVGLTAAVPPLKGSVPVSPRTCHVTVLCMDRPVRVRPSQVLDISALT